MSAGLTNDLEGFSAALPGGAACSVPASAVRFVAQDLGVVDAGR
jgi:hypothetical protein